MPLPQIRPDTTLDEFFRQLLSAAQILDGKFDDWTRIPRDSSVTDPVGDAGDDATLGSDLKQLVLEADGKRLHLLVAMNKAATIQGLERPLVIHLDAFLAPALLPRPAGGR